MNEAEHYDGAVVADVADARVKDPEVSYGYFSIMCDFCSQYSHCSHQFMIFHFGLCTT